MMKSNSQQPSLGLEGEYHRNSGLFADHFLDQRMPEMPEWNEASDWLESFNALRQLYAQAAPGLENANEPQTEEDFIKPVLRLLWGQDCYQVQVSVPTLVHRQPDYALFITPEERDRAEPLKGSLDYWREVAVVADAKAWPSTLDKAGGVHENPGSQMVDYMTRSRTRWGILTNGRTWRLYEKDKSLAGGVYFEVRLDAILRDEAIAAFKYFAMFFSRLGFAPDQVGRSFVERVYDESAIYAATVGDRLKDSIYDALRILMNGFLAHASNELDRNDPTTLKEVHDNSLIALYRLLFIMYAEDRQLLPVNTAGYRGYSLLSLHQDIHANLRDPKQQYLPRATGLWTRLCDLFDLIDKGEEAAGVPDYNGGLFRRERFPHIAYREVDGARRWVIGDSYLARVIDMLAYERNGSAEAGGSDVDYSTLEVQHLGSIYEGLLELNPHVAAEKLVECRRDGKLIFVSEAEAAGSRGVTGREVHPNEVYLTTDRGERKATGSYYTPKYVVDYIVENTVGPLANEAARTVEALRPDVDASIAELTRRAEALASDTERRKAERDIEKEKMRLLQPYLSLRVLDPAMGSGHFLVRAADHLSLAMATDPHLLPLQVMGDEDPQAYYKRLVAERCLYGVDLNPLAVELAKLSLWLYTVSRGTALSFLNHHLRAGNSLIGARLDEDLRQAPPRVRGSARQSRTAAQQPVLGFTEALTASHLSAFLEILDRIAESPTTDAESEHTKEGLFHELEAGRERFRQVANCWLAPYFGVAISAAQYEQAVGALRDDAAWEVLRQEPWFEAAQNVAQEQSFFHWELEFPEVFFERTGLKATEARGFDAVVGNPPYVRLHGIDEVAKTFLWARFETFRAKADLYTCFLHLCTDMARRCGFASMIVSKGWMYLDSFRAVRQRLLAQARLLQLVEFQGQVFEDAAVETMIMVIQLGPPDANHVVRAARVPAGAVPLLLGAVAQAAFSSTYLNILDLSLADGAASVCCSVVRAGVELGNLAVIDFGLKTGDDSQFLRRGNKSADDRPLLRGDNVQRYSHHYDGEYVWYVPDKMRAHKQTARPGERARFETPKIMVKDTSGSLGASLDLEGYYAKDVLLVHSFRDVHGQYLLSLINSRLLAFWYLRSFPTLHVQIGELARFPIRRVHFTTPEPERASLCQKGLELASHDIEVGGFASTQSFVREMLASDPERSDVVHDLLAALAEQMIEMNKTKQQETAGFLDWLERKIGAGIDTLTNKTKLRDYHNYTLEELLRVLAQNARKLPVSPATRAFQEEVQAEYEASLLTLTPLKARIANTDRLLDQIVYVLYGLTEEEIAVVESAA